MHAYENFKFGPGKDDLVVRSAPGGHQTFSSHKSDGVGRSDQKAAPTSPPLVAGRPRAICWLDISKFSLLTERSLSGLSLLLYSIRFFLKKKSIFLHSKQDTVYSYFRIRESIYITFRS